MTYKQYKSQKGSTFNILNYCNEIYDKLDKNSTIDTIIEAKNQGNAVNIDKIYQYIIKVCMGKDVYDEDLAYNFAIQGRSQLEPNSISNYKPIIIDLISGNNKSVAILQIKDKKYAVKIAHHHKLINERSDLHEKNSFIPKYRSLNSNGKFKLSKKDNIPKSVMDIKYEKEKYDFIKYKKKVRDIFIEVCDSDIYRYPDNIFVMAYGGKTLYDYMSNFVKGKAPVISFEYKNAFYKRLLKIFKILEKNNLKYCDLKPENIIFDPNDINNIKLIDFESIVPLSDYCKITTRSYSPPDKFIDRLAYNNYIKIIETFKKQTDIAKITNIIKKLREYLKIEINALKDKIRKSNSISLDSAITQKDDFVTLDANLELLEDTFSDLTDTTQIDKNILETAHEVIEEFFNVTEFPLELLTEFSNAEINNRRFDVYTIGVNIMQFELIYLAITNYPSKFKILSSIDEIQKLKKDAISFINRLNRYNTLELSIDDLWYIINRHIDSPKRLQKDLNILIGNIAGGSGFSYELLTYINKFILVDSEKRQTLKEFISEFNNISQLKNYRII